jgi:cytochrome P450
MVGGPLFRATRLSTDSSPFTFRTQSIHTYWGRNLLAANDIEWRRHRKVMQPAFNPKT